MQFLRYVDVRVVSRFRIPGILEYFINVETEFDRKVDIFTIRRTRIPLI